MFRLREFLTLSILFFGFTRNVQTEPARAPKIYNALISSDENLSPSQAFPIVEPVLRPTAFVSPYAQPYFQPILIRQPQQNQEGQQNPQNVPTNQQNPQRNDNNKPQLNYHDTYPLYPLSYDPYFQYGYHQNYFYSPPLPFYQQQPVYIDYNNPGHYQTPTQNQPQNTQQNPSEKQQNLPQQQGIEPNNGNAAPAPVVPVLPPQAPTPSHVNFKKNPEIPDVIPPLPFTLRRDNNRENGSPKHKRNYINA